MQQTSTSASFPHARVTGVCFLAMMPVVAAYSQPIDRTARLRFDPPNCGCSVIRSPELEHVFGGRFDFRRSASGALLVSRSPAVGPPYLFFQILDGPSPNAIPIGRHEWDSGKSTGWEVGMHSLFARAFSTPILKVESVSFRGRQYKRGGQHWAYHHVAALPSPDESLLVLQSYSGGYTTDKERKQGGEIFIDIYSTDSGARICRIAGTHQTYDGAGFLADTTWTANRELVASPDPRFFLQLLYCNFNSSRVQE